MDELTLQRIVARHFPDCRLIASARLVGGVSADVYRLDLQTEAELDTEIGTSSKSVVLRIHGDSHAGHGAQLEFDLMRALQKKDLPIAEPIAVDTSEEILADHYLLLKFVAGSSQVLFSQQCGSQQNHSHKNVFEQMARALVNIHSVSLKDLPDLPSRTEPLPELMDFLPEGQEWHELTQFLGSIHSQFDGDRVLLHGDYWPENLLWQGGDIVAILDWEDAAVGDRLSDVACCYLELSYLYSQSGAEKFLEAYSKVLLAQSNVELNQQRLLVWQIYVAAAAQKYMGQWGLPESKEAHMRQTALALIQAATQHLRRST